MWGWWQETCSCEFVFEHFWKPIHRCNDEAGGIVMWASEKTNLRSIEEKIMGQVCELLRMPTPGLLQKLSGLRMWTSENTNPRSLEKTQWAKNVNFWADQSQVCWKKLDGIRIGIAEKTNISFFRKNLRGLRSEFPRRPTTGTLKQFRMLKIGTCVLWASCNLTFYHTKVWWKHLVFHYLCSNLFMPVILLTYRQMLVEKILWSGMEIKDSCAEFRSTRRR